MHALQSPRATITRDTFLASESAKHVHSKPNSLNARENLIGVGARSSSKDKYKQATKSN